MAARKPKKQAPAEAPPQPTLFALAERQIVGLYDAGVLSPAVLHHVVAAYADSGIDWNEPGSLHTVDDRTVQEAVVLIMMPGRALRSAQKDFVSVVEHLAGKSEPKARATDDTNEEPGDDEDLLSQLGGNRSDEGGKKQETSSRKPAGFNPLVGARALPKHAKG
ncbi:hypothetical protein [Caballeronia sp. RCC_10]|uniref:hypothetical protein n=1 Tax=Caballeronia sp. RCC_10 TaxID=3239227 RepID=UPI003525D02D